MISEIQIDKAALTSDGGFEYAKKIEGLKSVRLGDGLNLILGSNGSGKSTLARMMACGCWADRAGFPHLSRMALEARTTSEASRGGLVRSGGWRMKLEGVKVTHDGQVLYVDSASTPDPETSMGTFMRSFVSGRVKAISHGERTYKAVEEAFLLMRQVAEPERHRSLEAMVEMRLKKYKQTPSDDRIKEIKKEEFEKLTKQGLSPFRSFPEALNEIGTDSQKSYSGQDSWAKSMRKRMDIAIGNFSPALPKGKPTLVLDEPERSMSLVAQANLWSLICNPKVLSAYQIVIVSHSLFAIDVANCLKGTNLIEMSDGYCTSTISYIDKFRNQLRAS